MNYIKMYLIVANRTKAPSQPLECNIKIIYNEVVIYTLNTLVDLLTVKIGPRTVFQCDEIVVLEFCSL